jgi:hypothetical protein
MLKSREPRWLAIEQRVASRGDRDGAYSAASAAALSNQLSISAGGQPARTGRGAPAKRTGPIRPGSGTAVLDRPAGGTGAGGGAAGAPRPSGSGGGAAAPRPRKGKGKRQR